MQAGRQAGRQAGQHADGQMNSFSSQPSISTCKFQLQMQSIFLYDSFRGFQGWGLEVSSFGGHTRRDCTFWRNKNELPQFTPRQFLDERCALEGKKKNELPQFTPRFAINM